MDAGAVATFDALIATFDALITLAFRRQPDGDEHTVAQAKALVREYLHRHLEIPGAE